jgi:hypothetical protein
MCLIILTKQVNSFFLNLHEIPDKKDTREPEIAGFYQNTLKGSSFPKTPSGQRDDTF